MPGPRPSPGVSGDGSISRSDWSGILADRVAVISAGELITVGTPAELTAGSRFGSGLIRFRLPTSSAVGDLPRIGDGPGVQDGLVELHSSSPTRDLQRLTGWAVDLGLELEELTIAPPTFEETYIELVGEAEGQGHG